MSEHFQDAFARLGDAVAAQRAAAANGSLAKPAGVEVSVIGGNGGVEVTVADEVVTSFRVDRGWLQLTEHPRVEKELARVTTEAFERYREAALQRMRETSPDFDRLQEIMRESQQRLLTAFNRTVDDSLAEAQRNVDRLREG